MTRQERCEDIVSCVRFGWLVTLALVLVAGRLVEVQLIRPKAYRQKMPLVRLSKLEPRRGEILDREGVRLVINKPAASVGYDLRQSGNPTLVVRQLGPILGQSPDALQAKLARGGSFVWLGRRLSAEVGDRVRGLGLLQVRVVDEWRRAYPFGTTACHLLGFTDVDNRGLAGIEYAWDDRLHGKPGLAHLHLDAQGRVFRMPGAPQVDPVPGETLILTIHRVVQRICEEELLEAVRQFDAAAACAVVVEPQTGHLLALACAPLFDPSEGTKVHPDLWRLRPITDAYELGSVMKLVPMALVFEEHLRTPEETVFCENGRYRVLGQTIEDHEPYSWLTVREVLVNSSNIGIAKIGLKVLPELLLRYERNFGFGTATGIELKGEARGIVPNLNQWSAFTPAAMSYGYEIAVTPLQVAMAYAAVANGGVLMRPKVVLGTVRDGKEDLSLGEPEAVRRVISEATAQMLNEILVDVVDHGTGRKAQIPGHKIAGKTGTARKVKPQGLGHEERYLSSFVGYYPAEIGKAELCILVVVDDPKGQYYAADVAAPTFKRILQRILKWRGEQEVTPPVEAPEEIPAPSRATLVAVPVLQHRDVSTCRAVLRELGLRAQWQGRGEFVQKQYPEPGAQVAIGSTIVLELGAEAREAETGERLLMPRVIGLTAREAVNRLRLLGVHVDVSGAGRVVRQHPAPGEEIRRGGRCTLECQSGVALVDAPRW
ncbi:MAG: penicillin-binding transpeptidase domain-containing protein [bacterium]|nr:penicillin-binding transpeptidase domain-containing protein [candidate division KSB1 bacterium]MDH7559189.1 penicillin-binding transpeptidase domain-containing protein [bacterium]